MENREIVTVLERIAVLKELAGENAFKTRSFQNAARALEGLDRPAAGLYAEGRLREIPGVGEAIATVIGELLDTGTCAELRQLMTEIPQGLLDILELQGVGPKKARAVWQKLGITTLDGLEKACREHRLQGLDGFGPKSEGKILEAVGFKRSRSGFFLFDQALALARALVVVLEESGLCQRVEIAGSLRRGKDLVKDADILVVCQSEKAIPALREKLISLADRKPGTGDERDIIGQGDTKVSIRFRGLQVDFRIILSRSAACALQYFTGSKDHNTQLRGRAKTLGYKVNEYEIAGEKKSLHPKSEEEFYETLGLAWIPPELREGGGELEAAESRRLPRLVERRDLCGLIHCHTTYSDGALSLNELAAECRERGYQYLCLSDHSRSARYAGGLLPEMLHKQRAEIEVLNRAYTPFRIFHGVESDILIDGSLDYPPEILGGLDFVIGAVHSKLTMTKPEATARLLAAVSNPYLTILAHPSGRLLLARDGYEYDSGRLLAALAEYGVVLEHNCHPARLDPDWRILKQAAAAGITVSLDSDLHGREGFEHIDLGVCMARKAWLGPAQILNCRSREEIDEYFRKRKERSGGRPRPRA
jgi:DNA polymerase (family 10)